MIKYGVIGGVILIIVTLIVVLSLTLGGGAKPKPPVPPKPVVERGLNFYYIETSTEKNTAYSRKGVVVFNETKFNNMSALYSTHS